MSGPPPSLPALRADIATLVFTHKSLFGKPANLVEDVEMPQDWERLSFMGEGVLHAAASNVLYLAYPRHRTSFLKPQRVQMISKEALASITDRYRFMDSLRCLEASRPAISRSLDNRAALAESFVGGIALQYGTATACEWAENLLIWKHELVIPLEQLRQKQALSRPDVPSTSLERRPSTPLPDPQADLPSILLEETPKLITSHPKLKSTAPELKHTRPKASEELPPPSGSIASPFAPMPSDNLTPVASPLPFFDSTAVPNTLNGPLSSSHYHGLFSAGSFKAWEGEIDPNLALYVPSPERPSTPMSDMDSSAAVTPAPRVAVPPNFGAVAKLNEIASRRGQKPDWAFESEGQGAFIQWKATVSLRNEVIAEARGSSKQLAKDLAAQNAMEAKGWL